MALTGHGEGDVGGVVGAAEDGFVCGKGELEEEVVVVRQCLGSDSERRRSGKYRSAGAMEDLSMSGSRQAPPWTYLETSRNALINVPCYRPEFFFFPSSFFQNYFMKNYDAKNVIIFFSSLFFFSFFKG